MDRRLQAQLEADPVLQEATEWLVELHGGNVPGERISQWQQWLAEGAHQQAFDRVESLWHMTAEVKPAWPSQAELTRDEYAGNEGIAAWRARTRPDPAEPGRGGCPRQLSLGRGPWRWGRGRFGALAATAMTAALAVGVIYWPAIRAFFQGGSRIFVHTGIGQTRTFTLQDGTAISVGPDTTLTVTLRAHSRSIALRSGEAYFRVRKEPSRPFTVRAGHSTVTDLGTLFDVRHVDRGIVVSVAEGMVRVTTSLPQPHGAPSKPSGRAARVLAIRLRTGQRLALEPFDTVPRIATIDPKWVASWRQNRLHYLDEPLGSVVADLDRYSRRRISVADPAIARLRVTAVVTVQGIDAWLASLAAAFPVRVVRQPGAVIIEPRHTPGIP